MEVANRLAAVFTGIYDDTVTVCKALLARHFCRRPEEMAKECLVALIGVSERADVLARDDENVGGRLGVDVRESVDQLVLVDRAGRDVAFGDLAEDAV